MSGAVVWVVWDAAPAWATARLLAEGALPHLEALARDGVRAAARPVGPYCQTPPCLATLFCGVGPREHGVQGFVVPDGAPDRPVTATRSGFDRAVLRATPAWRRAAAAGLRVVAPFVPWTLPVDAGEPADRYLLLAAGYADRITRGRTVKVAELEMPPAGNAGAAGAAGARLVRIGPHACAVREEAGGLVVEAPAGGGRLALDAEDGRRGGGDDWRRDALVLEPGVGVYARAYRRPGDGALMLAHSGAWRVAAHPAAAAGALFAAAGPFCGEGLGGQYRVGGFGPRILDGGDGAAEALFVDSLAWCADYFARAAAWAARAHDADLYVFYQPATDDAGHELLGWCDPQSRCFRPEGAPALWEHVRRAFQFADDGLGRVLDAFGPGAAVVVSSDHGMAGIGRTVLVNEALARAGLLSFTPDGQVDLGATAALFHPAANCTVWVNTSDRPGGIVPPGRRQAVAAEAARALGELRDPVDGRPVIAAIYPAGGAGDGEDGRWFAGDLFLVPADGFELRADRGEAVVRPAQKSGHHLAVSGCASLEGVLFARGPGLGRGVDLGTISNRDVAPLVCRLLGIEPPHGGRGEPPCATRSSATSTGATTT